MLINYLRAEYQTPLSKTLKAVCEKKKLDTVGASLGDLKLAKLFLQSEF